MAPFAWVLESEIRGANLNMDQAEPNWAQSTDCWPADLREKNKCCKPLKFGGCLLCSKTWLTHLYSRSLILGCWYVRTECIWCRSCILPRNPSAGWFPGGAVGGLTGIHGHCLRLLWCSHAYWLPLRVPDSSHYFQAWEKSHSTTCGVWHCQRPPKELGSTTLKCSVLIPMEQTLTNGKLKMGGRK